MLIIRSMGMYKAAVWAVSALGLCVCARGAAVTSVSAVNPAGGARTFEVTEWAVKLDREYPNPFDPEEIALEAMFSGPGGRTIVLPGFWYQDYRRQSQARGRENLVAAGEGEWRVRFSATDAGNWRMVVTAKDRAGTSRSQAVSFAVERGNARGFVRRAEGNWRYFRLDSGEPYFIVGLNLSWTRGGNLGDYERWLTRLGAAGGNFARLWLTYPSRPMETREAGLGRYDLGACWFYDKVLKAAADNGVYCMAALGTYGDLIEGGHFNEGRWPLSPYNAVNGGPATRPADLFEKREGRELYKRRLRYLIGRYSAYTSLGFWEFWNEQDNAKVTVSAAWTAEMARFLKANDPYQRLVTTSFSGTGDAAVWRLPDVDLTQRHVYGDEESLFDASPFIASDARAADGYAKPHLVGEYGISWRGSDSRYDAAGLATNLHNSLWAGAMSGGAGGACNWWWDDYVDPKDLWGRFTGLAKFAAAVDWPRRDFRPIRVLSPMFESNDPETFVDVVLPAGNSWGRSDGEPRVLEPDGTLSAGLPGYLFGPEKPELRVKTTLKVNLPQPSKMTVRVLRVSNFAALRVIVDEKPVVDFPLSALPGAAGLEKTERVAEHRIYQGSFNKDYSADIPAGAHTIALDNVGGDWMTIGSVTFAKARSSRYTGVRVMALQDASSGETVAWLQDPASHVGADRAGAVMRRFEGAVMSVPADRPGSYSAEWWDTREGKVVGRERVTAQGGFVRAGSPAFTRDIAMRMVAEKGGGQASR